MGLSLPGKPGGSPITSWAQVPKPAGGIPASDLDGSTLAAGYLTRTATESIAARRVTASDGVVGMLVNGPVTDASFVVAPPNGTFATDATTGRLYQRIGGTWRYVALAGAGTAVPATIAGLHSWYDFSQTLLADNAAIATWQDLSGNSRTLAVPAGKSAPIYKANVRNGKGVARFDGSGALESANFTAGALSQPVTAFAVVRASLGSTATETVLSAGGGTPSISALNTGVYGVNTGAPAYRVTSGGSKQNDFVLLTVVLGATGTTLVRQNGVQVASATDTATATIAKWWLGNSSTATTGLVGDLAEVIVYSGRLSMSDILTVEAYLS